MSDSFSKFAAKVAEPTAASKMESGDSATKPSVGTADQTANQPSNDGKPLKPAIKKPAKPSKQPAKPIPATLPAPPSVTCDCIAPYGLIWLTPFKQWKCCLCEAPSSEKSIRLFAMFIVSIAPKEAELWKDAERPPKSGEWLVMQPGHEGPCTHAMGDDGEVRAILGAGANWPWPWPPTGPECDQHVQDMVFYDDPKAARGRFRIDPRNHNHWKYLMSAPPGVSFEDWWASLPTIDVPSASATRRGTPVMNSRDAARAAFGELGKGRGRRRR